MICAFTGHRPEKLPWGCDETDLRCQALCRLLEQTVRELADRGVDTFLCGMARGCDLYFARAVEKLKGEGLPIRLEAWLPCPEQTSLWGPEDVQAQKELLLECDGVYMLEPCYREGCMLRRNRAMIDRADLLLSVWDGTRGGTASAVRYARSQGVEVISLWL